MLENAFTSDVPVPVSRFNDVTLAFEERTATVFGPPEQEQTFSVAMRSFPTPAVFTWPPGFTQVDSLFYGDSDVTVVTTTVIVENDETHQLTVNSGQSQLSSEITIELKVRGNCSSFLWRGSQKLIVYFCNVKKEQTQM